MVNKGHFPPFLFSQSHSMIHLGFLLQINFHHSSVSFSSVNLLILHPALWIPALFWASICINSTGALATLEVRTSSSDPLIPPREQEREEETLWGVYVCVHVCGVCVRMCVVCVCFIYLCIQPKLTEVSPLHWNSASFWELKPEPRPGP